MNETLNAAKLSNEAIARAKDSFLILDAQANPLPEPEGLTLLGEPLVACLRDAADGLRSVLSAATLPFQLILSGVSQRRWDRFSTAERIRLLKPSGEAPTEEELKAAHEKAEERMQTFMASDEGSTFVRDALTHEMVRRLEDKHVAFGVAELKVQTLVAIWAVFEHFASSFIVRWIDQDPKRSRSVLNAPELKSYFGRQVVDIEAIDDHGFDLSRSMGSMIFRDKRLDNLVVIREVMNALFNDAKVRAALGTDLWMLNQRRHLFVHKRGLVDQEYLRRTGDTVPIGEPLRVSSWDIQRYSLAVQIAIRAITTSAINTMNPVTSEPAVE